MEYYIYPIAKSMHVGCEEERKLCTSHSQPNQNRTDPTNQHTQQRQHFIFIRANLLNGVVLAFCMKITEFSGKTKCMRNRMSAKNALQLTFLKEYLPSF